VIIVNFKRYLDEIGAERLAGICRRISQECKLEVVVAVEAEHLEKCLQTGVECWTQKFEPMANGYKGSLINHSDFRLGWEVVKDQVVELGNRGKRVCVCAATVEEAVAFAKFGQEFVGYEPPSLIGSREKSVASEKPEDIARVVTGVNGVGVLVGAGIHSKEDVKVGLKLGAVGVLVATDVVKVEDPEKELRELAEAFTN
jgi:triosephosphate isomerase